MMIKTTRSLPRDRGFFWEFKVNKDLRFVSTSRGRLGVERLISLILRWVGKNSQWGFSPFIDVDMVREWNGFRNLEDKNSVKIYGLSAIKTPCYRMKVSRLPLKREQYVNLLRCEDFSFIFELPIVASIDHLLYIRDNMRLFNIKANTSGDELNLKEVSYGVLDRFYLKFKDRRISPSLFNHLASIPFFNSWLNNRFGIRTLDRSTWTKLRYLPYKDEIELLIRRLRGLLRSKGMKSLDYSPYKTSEIEDLCTFLRRVKAIIDVFKVDGENRLSFYFRIYVQLNDCLTG